MAGLDPLTSTYLRIRGGVLGPADGTPGIECFFASPESLCAVKSLELNRLLRTRAFSTSLRGRQEESFFAIVGTLVDGSGGVVVHRQSRALAEIRISVEENDAETLSEFPDQERDTL